jgi:sensor histidine kinase YesM
MAYDSHDLTLKANFVSWGILNNLKLMPKYFFARENLKIQAIGWPIYLLVMIWINDHLYPATKIGNQLGALILLMIVFNACVGVLYLFFMTRWGWFAIVLLIIVFWVGAELVFISVYKIMPNADLGFFREQLVDPDDLYYWRMLNKYFGVLVMAAGLVLQIKSKKNLLLKEKEEKLKHEQELQAKESELAFLAAQINPHFLYNVLTKIHQECSPTIPNIANMLEALAGLLKYTVLNASKRIKKVVIEKELDALEKYIQLERSRFEQCFVHYQVHGEACGQKIPPGTLITITENAFKFGVCKNPNKPIMIDLYLFDDRIEFSCHNWVDYGKRGIVSTGLGLKNVEYRLNMVFPGNYSLDIDNSDMDVYHVKLIINQ